MSDTGSEIKRILQALIFASTDIISTQKIKEILPDNIDSRIIRKMVNEINVKLHKEKHPFEIVALSGGYQFRTITYYQPWVQRLFKEKSVRKLSIQALECIAILAYKQPITKSQLEHIRGVLSDGAIKTLLEKRLITIVGRSDKPGKPLLYGTTPDFLKYFGINKITDLPRIEEFEEIAKEKMQSEIDDDYYAVLNQLPDVKQEELLLEKVASPEATIEPLEMTQKNVKNDNATDKNKNV